MRPRRKKSNVVLQRSSSRRSERVPRVKVPTGRLGLSHPPPVHHCRRDHNAQNVIECARLIGMMNVSVRGIEVGIGNGNG